MPSRLSATQLLDEPAQQVVPWSATRTFDPAGSPDTLARISGPLSENGNQGRRLDPLHSTSLSTSTPRRRTTGQGLTIGALSYLLSLGLVAATTVAICFGFGFISLGHPTEEMIAGFGTRDRGTEDRSPRVGGFPYSASADLPAPVETELPRSVAATVLPAFSGAQNLAEHEAFPSDAHQFSAREAPGSATGGASSTLKVPASRSTTRKARTKPVHTIPALRSTGHGATLTPPTEIGPVLRTTGREATLTPPAEAGPALRSTGHDATLTPPTQTGPMLK